MNYMAAEMLVNLKDIAVGLSIIASNRDIDYYTKIKADKMLAKVLEEIDKNIK